MYLPTCHMIVTHTYYHSILNLLLIDQLLHTQASIILCFTRSDTHYSPTSTHTSIATYIRIHIPAFPEIIPISLDIHFERINIHVCNMYGCNKH